MTKERGPVVGSAQPGPWDDFFILGIDFLAWLVYFLMVIADPDDAKETGDHRS